MNIVTSTQQTPNTTTCASPPAQNTSIQTSELQVQQQEANQKAGSEKPKNLKELAQICSIDWVKLKMSDYSAWRDTLFKTSQLFLRYAAQRGTPLSDFNSIGTFHKIPASYYDEMRKEYGLNNKPLARWVTKGLYPGIWCALFNQDNTYSMGMDIRIIKITFKAEFRLFDPELKEHAQLQQIWESNKDNLKKPNPWKDALGTHQMSMADRMSKGCGIMFREDYGPSHLSFFKENGFGAFVGYSDYMGLVIADEECIDKVEFM